MPKPTECDGMNLDAIMVFLIIAWVTCLHELLHIAGFVALKIKYKVSIIYWHHIPIAISLDSDNFKEDFLKMNQANQFRYTIIATLPYLFIVPFFMYLSGFGLVLALTSLIVIVVHGINFGLEFVDIRKVVG